jgi:hypothetical protein
MKKLLLIALLLFAFVPDVHAKANNYALSFDGTDSYVELPYAVGFQPTGGNFSAEAWVYIDEGAPNDQKILMTLGGWSKGYAMNIYQDGGGNYYFAASIYLSGNQYWAEDVTKFIPAKTWTHVAMTWNQNGNLTAYQNGQMIAQTSTGTSIYTESENMITIGCGYTNMFFSYFQGKIDEVRIWDITRTEAEIHDNMNIEIGANTNLKAYYEMSDGSGTSLTDNSGNGNTGTLMDESMWVISDNPMPVELTSFTASVTNNAVALRWNTATEVNNYGFDIERRVIASSTWTKIGFVSGNGTSNTSHSYSYADNSAGSGTYAYRLKQIDNDGTYKYSQESEVTIVSPKSTVLHQNYPNPFNPTTQISYDVAAVGTVRLAVYDILGREVAVLVNEQKEPGSYTAQFNASQLSSGIYFSKLTANQFLSVHKMTLMK